MAEVRDHEVKELHSPNGGAVGRVKRVGDGVLKELRAAIRRKPKLPGRKEGKRQHKLTKPNRLADDELHPPRHSPQRTAQRW